MENYQNICLIDNENAVKSIKCNQMYLNIYKCL